MENETTTSPAPKAAALCGPAKYLLIGFGLICTGMGFVGLVVPGIPGVVFFLIALWAFSKSSERFHLWLYNHKVVGKPLRDWHEHRVIPVRGKIAAVGMMSITGITLFVLHADKLWLPLLATSCIIAVSIWLIRKPSVVPTDASIG